MTDESKKWMDKPAATPSPFDIEIVGLDDVADENEREITAANYTDVEIQRQKFIKWIEHNNSKGKEAVLVKNLTKDLDKAISKPDHHYEWQFGASLTRLGKPYILKWIEGAFQVIEVDQKTLDKLDLGENSIKFIERQTKTQNNITSALTAQQKVRLKQVHLAHTYRLNGYRPVYGFVELQVEETLDENNIALVMEHEIYYASLHTKVANYFHAKAIKTNPSGQTVLDFNFPGLNCDERQLQGLFSLNFRLMDKANSKNTDDWILISNTLSHQVEVV